MADEKHKWTVEPSYAELIRLLETLNAGLTIYSLEGEILFASDRILEWTGHSAADLDGQSAAILVPEELHGQIEGEIERILSGDQRARVGVLRRKDGRRFPIVSCARAQREGDDATSIVTVSMALADIQTARPIGDLPDDGLAGSLARIGHELQIIGLSAGDRDGASAIRLDHPALDLLSRREREILAELVVGTRVPAIARRLFISPHTVRNHLKSMFRKLDVSGQAELIERVRVLSKDRERAASQPSDRI